MCCRLTEFSGFSQLKHFPFRPPFFILVFCPLVLYPNHYGVPSFFQFESTNNVWSSQHQGCCHRVAMATPSPHTVMATAERTGSQRQSAHILVPTHTHTHRSTQQLPPSHGANPCSFALTTSGSVKAIIENKYTLVYYAKRNEGATELYYDLPSDSVWYSRYFMRMCMLWHTQFNTLINCSQISLVYHCFKATLWIGPTSNWVDVYFAHTGKFLFFFFFF